MVVRRRRGPLVAPFVLDLTVLLYRGVLVQVSRDANLILGIWMMHPQLPPVIPYTNQPRLLGLTYRTVPYFPKVTMLNGFQEKLTLLHTSLIIEEMTTLMTELRLKTSLFNVAAVAVTDVLVHLPLPMVVVTVTASVVTEAAHTERRRATVTVTRRRTSPCLVSQPHMTLCA